MQLSKLNPQTHEVTIESGLMLQIFQFVLWLFLRASLCFDFLSLRLLVTDFNQAGIKECSVSLSVAQANYQL